MTTANLEIIHAGVQVSLQDQGRFGQLRYGVPASGPMDRFACAIANLALGNLAQATVIEVSLGGLVLLCTKAPISFALAGGHFQASIDKKPLPAWCVATLRVGETLSITQGRWGSWCYLAMAGHITCNPWLGSASTHGPSGLGGGVLATGGQCTVENAQVRQNRHATISCPVTALPRHEMRVILGPQDRYFSRDTVQTLLSKTFSLTDAYDRMGVRLSGPSLRPDGALNMPSEAIIRGSVQVAGDGVATVLLADHQTTGGYPKIATILSTDIDAFVQLRSRSEVRFVHVSPEMAIAAARTRDKSRSDYLAQIGQDFRKM